MKPEEFTRPVHSAEFITGIIGTDPILEDDREHIAFIGRSNVGKSSLINFVLGRNSLVRSSARPGKTTEINFFDIDNQYYFVDLPGYGFARMGEKQREKLRKLILWYLMYAGVHKRKTFVVLDAQVGITPFDQEIIDELTSRNEQVFVVLNKIDKLNQKEKHAIVEHTKTLVSCPVLETSTQNKKGFKLMWDAISA